VLNPSALTCTHATPLDATAGWLSPFLHVTFHAHVLGVQRLDTMAVLCDGLQLFVSAIRFNFIKLMHRVD
jgi:hypothetical protein